jgi:hypothetical protein
MEELLTIFYSCMDTSAKYGGSAAVQAAPSGRGGLAPHLSRLCASGAVTAT